MAEYFFDTYALICLVQDKESYKRFADSIILTSQFNLVELYYSVLQDFGEKKAKEIYLTFKNCLMEVSDEIIFKAMDFRLKIKKDAPKSNISYIDCIGYECAKASKVKFVTGDKEFKGIENVEFVTK